MKNPTSSSFLSGKTLFTLLFLVITIMMTSCFGSKPVSYFSNGVLDTTRVDKINLPDPTIQKGDILNIIVYSDNPEATAIYNQAAGSQSVSNVSTSIAKSPASSSQANTNTAGYLVDNEGSIRMHALGVLHVEGLTKQQLSDTILKKLNDLGVLSNPYCVIRFSNFKVSVLGEVKNPGVFTLQGEKTSILEVLGMAGDITDFGLKQRVILIREVNGNRTYRQLNLLDPNVMSSPDFYLRQNDVILVEADKKKPTAMDTQTLALITVGAALISSVAILINLFK